MAKGIRKKMRIKKGDRVIVRSGRDKGKSGQVIGVFPDEARALVSQINMVWRHERPSQKGPGGRVQKEAKIHISNLSVIDPKENKPTRIGYRFLANGKKVRFARRSGEVIDNV